MAEPTGASETRDVSWRERIRIVIFEADTPLGKLFDVSLLVAIVLSIGVIMLESVTWIRVAHGPALDFLEWGFTLLFSIEYLLRLISVPKPWHYARSFFGIVDLLSILPTYLSLLVPGAETMLVIRALRLLRIFRVFKLGRFLGEASLLTRALAGSRHKVTIFLGSVLILVIILGSAMYLIEGEEHGFDSIPRGVYWAIVTLTTVGYGDITPQTTPGKFLASLVMILGYSIIAVPTGIVTAEIVEAATLSRRVTTRCCPDCTREGHETDADFCKYCGESLDGDADSADDA
jgi:voltage-gated potassium channel